MVAWRNLHIKPPNVWWLESFKLVSTWISWERDAPQGGMGLSYPFQYNFLCISLPSECLSVSLSHPFIINWWFRKILCRKEWLPTPVFLPGKYHGQRSLVGYSPRGRKESDMTEHIHTTHKIFICLQKSISLSALYVIDSDKKSPKDCVPELIENWSLELRFERSARAAVTRFAPKLGYF